MSVLICAEAGGAIGSVPRRAGPSALCRGGRAIGGEQDALESIGDAGYRGARWVDVTAGRFEEPFLRLGTRVAGDTIPKFVNYRMGIIVPGGNSLHLEASSDLRGFVRECDRDSGPGSSPKPRSRGAEELGWRPKGQRVPPAGRPATGRTAGGVVPPGGCALSRGSAAR
ncbi:DUF4180 domain-containing protein [Streptomyces sp. NPDC094461]|uniref:DUF4180 domain-containing protein n=1 Tax=Streptomyces sp. NPDC094461 TaxID=3366064 RepID=UPI003826F831